MTDPKAADLMEFLENNSGIEKHFYTMTHTIKDNQPYEVYCEYKNKRWKIRPYAGFDLSQDNWEEFSKETVEDYFQANELCLDNVRSAMFQNILIGS